MRGLVAHVSLRGTREPLLLVATGLFLVSFWMPITGALGSAGIALGMHDLRKSEAATTLGRLRVATVILAWCTCALWAASYFLNRIPQLELITQTLTIFCTALALRMLARIDSARGLAVSLLVLCWTPFAFVPLLWAHLATLATLFHIATTLALAVLALQLHGRAVPYGKRLVKRTA